jgi:hypothetical protein
VVMLHACADERVDVHVGQLSDLKGIIFINMNAEKKNHTHLDLDNKRNRLRVLPPFCSDKVMKDLHC